MGVKVHDAAKQAENIGAEAAEKLLAFYRAAWRMPFIGRPRPELVHPEVFAWLKANPGKSTYDFYQERAKNQQPKSEP